MAWLLLLPLLLLLPNLTSFIYQPGAAYSDLLISHTPNAVFLKQALLEWHRLPFWSDTILSGYPFAADPLSGLWYPPGWLGILLPAPLGFNLAILLHLLWGGVGMYVYLKSEELSPLPALLGAVAFEAMPKLISHFAAGHMTLVYAVAWTPWLLRAENRRIRAGSGQRWRGLSGVLLGVIALADVRWAAFAGLVWLFYALARRNLFESRPGEASSLAGRLARFAAYALGQVALAVALAAPLLLPLLEFSRLSTRAGLTPAEAFTLSLPPSRLLGLIVPDPRGYAEWILYPGAVGLVLFVVVLLDARGKPPAKFWIWAALLSLVYSLGSAIPFLPLLANLPGLDLLRVPSRALFVAGTAFAVLSAYGAQTLIEWSSIKRKIRIDPGLALSALAAGVLLLVGGLFFLQKEPSA